MSETIVAWCSSCQAIKEWAAGPLGYACGCGLIDASPPAATVRFCNVCQRHVTSIYLNGAWQCEICASET